MRYALALLTHGDAAPLRSTLDSFYENVIPAPRATVLCYDGPTIYGHDSPELPPLRGSGDQTFLTTGGPIGFCRATARLWQVVSQLPDVDYVFWLEHDFEFLRQVDLRPLSLALDVDQKLAQMALMRNAVNPSEVEAGGLFELRKHDYRPKTLVTGDRYLEHDVYFTTNPSLMRRAFMVTAPWTTHPSLCEGRYGLALREFGYHFGAWGDGEPWIHHRGERTGFGY